MPLPRFVAGTVVRVTVVCPTDIAPWHRVGDCERRKRPGGLAVGKLRTHTPRPKVGDVWYIVDLGIPVNPKFYPWRAGMCWALNMNDVETYPEWGPLKARPATAEEEAAWRLSGGE